MSSDAQLPYILPTAPKSLCGWERFIFQLSSISCLKTLNATATCHGKLPAQPSPVTEFQGLTSTSISLSWLYQRFSPMQMKKNVLP